MAASGVHSFGPPMLETLSLTPASLLDLASLVATKSWKLELSSHFTPSTSLPNKSCSSVRRKPAEDTLSASFGNDAQVGSATIRRSDVDLR